MTSKIIKWGSSYDKEYFVDVNAFMETRDKAMKEGFQHSCHQHLLQLREVFVDSTNDKCNGCGLFIRGYVYYTCTTLNCVFHLHEFCAHLPQNMTHLILDEGKCQHIDKLALMFPDEDFFRHYIDCNVCDKPVLGNTGMHLKRGIVIPRTPKPEDSKIFYQCLEDRCNFTADLRCVALALAVKDPGHKHALTPHLYSSSFLCSICGLKNDDTESLSYICHECSFWVHDSCYPLPRTIEHATHPHSLDISYNEKDIFMGCGICRKNSVGDYWWYKCQPCSYTVHVQCSFKKRIEMVLPKLDEEEVKSMIKFFFPNKKSVHQTFTQLVRKMCKSEEKEESSSEHKLLHQSNDDCQLVIFESIINNDDDIPVCDACVLPICESPFYACVGDSCKFFIHKWCSNLPKECKFECKIEGHNPDHTLVLMEKKRDEFGFHYCPICMKWGNGFFYKCRECAEFYIDIKCASLPNSIMHQIHHQHPLRLLHRYAYKLHTSCYCCGYELKNVAYGCKPCHLYLHVYCTWFPHEMEHRYDEHPYSLVYEWPVTIAEDEYHCEYNCEFCEGSIPNKKCFYHCHQCDRSAHATCVGRDLYPTVKFGTRHVSSDHEHPLTCVRLPTRWMHQMEKRCFICDRAQVDGDQGAILECLICKISRHVKCDYMKPTNSINLPLWFIRGKDNT